MCRCYFFPTDVCGTHRMNPTDFPSSTTMKFIFLFIVKPLNVACGSHVYVPLIMNHNNSAALIFHTTALGY